MRGAAIQEYTAEIGGERQVFMHVPRWLTVLLVVATVTATIPSVPATAQRTRQLLGTGARFVPGDTALYATVDLTPDSDQFAQLDRLVEYYLGTPAVQQAVGDATQPIGLYADADDLWRDLVTWVGGEAFVAVPSVQDLRTDSRASLGAVNLDCREPGILFGVAIGSPSALQEFLSRIELTLRVAGTRTRTEQYQGIDIVVVGGSPEGGSTYLGVVEGYLLISESYGLLTRAIDRSPADSLAANPAFHEATDRFVSSSFAMVYASVPDDLLGLGDRGSPGATTRWIAGGLRLGAESIQVDVAAALRPELLSAAIRTLLAKTPNAVRSANVAPAESSVFVGWDNLKLIWDAVKELISPEDYQDFRQSAIRETGLDPDTDVFDWMTGEFTVFVSPSRERGGLFGELGFGIAIEARDRAVARAKADRYVEAARRLLPPEQPVSEQIISELSFYRFPVSRDTALYGQLVEDWLIVTSSAGVAADVVASLRGEGSLQGQAEYHFVRSALPNPLQFLAYSDVPRLVSTLGTTLGDDASEVAEWLRPLRGVGLGVHTTADRVELGLFVHLVIPPGTIARSTRAGVENELRRGPEVLIDASKSGQVWWPLREEPSPRRLPTGGAPLVRFLKDEVGVALSDTVFPDQRIGRLPRGRSGLSSTLGPTGTSSQGEIIEPYEEVIIRVGAEGAYERGELAAYRDYVFCGGRLLLLADGQRPGLTDELAETFGLRVGGVVSGTAELSEFRPHRATSGARPMPMSNGTGLVGWDEATDVIGFLPPDGFLDLNGNGELDDGEPTGAPVLAIRPYGRGTVVFLGTTSAASEPDQPAFRAVLRHLLWDAPWPGPLQADAFEPDNTFMTARPLPGDSSRQAHTIHEPGDVDWVRIALGSNERVRLSAASTVDECVLQITLYASDGATAVAQTRNAGPLGATVEYRAGEAGTYYAEIQQRPAPFDTCRAYTLSGRITPPPAPDEAEPDNAPTEAKPLPVESRGATRTIHTGGDVDWSVVALQRGERVRISVLPESFDCQLTIAIQTPDGRLTEGDSFGPFTMLDYTAATEGLHYVRVQAAEPGALCDGYRLDVRLQRPVPPDAFEPDDTVTQAKPLPLDGAPQARSLHVPGDSDWVSFTLGEGDRVRIFTRARECDTYLHLYAPDGQTVLVEDDDSGEGVNALVLYTAPQAGTYYARVRHYAERTGTCESYTLIGAVDRGRGAPVPLAPTMVIPTPGLPMPTVVPSTPTQAAMPG